MNLYLEILLILGLILLNGFFAAAEIAILSLRRSKTKELVNKRVNNAILVDGFQKNPQRFLATIQVGITFVSTIASAFGGAQVVEDVAPLLQRIPINFISANAQVIAFFVVVILISYFSLVLGELVPKSLALRFTQKIALAVSYPISLCSSLFSIFIGFLTVSSNFILKAFKGTHSYIDALLSEEELRSMLEESKEAGTIEKREHEFIENIFEFGDLEVGKVMIPHSKMFTINIELNEEEIIKKMLKYKHTRIPVYEGHPDNIIGIIYSKDVFIRLAKKQKINIREIMRPPIFVPTTQRLHDVLQKFKKKQMHMIIVLDEHGGVDGLVTMEDVLEEIVGDIKDEVDETNKEIRKQEDGSYLVDGSTSITDFNRILDIELPEDAPYNSISGFLLDIMKRFPKKNEKVQYENLEFQITEKTRKRIKTIHVRKVKIHNQ